MCCTRSVYEHNFGDLRTASVTDHTLVCATAFFTFSGSHKSVHSRRVLLTYFSWCASSAQPAVKIFFQFPISAFALPEPEHFEDVKRLHTLSTRKRSNINCGHPIAQRQHRAVCDSPERKGCGKGKSGLNKGVPKSFSSFKNSASSFLITNALSIPVRTPI